LTYESDIGVTYGTNTVTCHNTDLTRGQLILKLKIYEVTCDYSPFINDLNRSKK